MTRNVILFILLVRSTELCQPTTRPCFVICNEEAGLPPRSEGPQGASPTITSETLILCYKRINPAWLDFAFPLQQGEPLEVGALNC